MAQFTNLKKINILEVGPRDGFQNITEYIPFDEKYKIVEALVKSGVQHIQVTSFVSPKAIPQMKDSAELVEKCLKTFPQTHFFALVPNLKGAENAQQAGLNSVSYVASLSETHNLKNINKTHEKSLEEFRKIRESLPDLKVTLDLATAFGCPFEGKKTPEQVLDFLKAYVESGLAVVNLCDTIGVANPRQVRDTIELVRQNYPALEIQVHIHDTRNMGMVNTLAAIECGVESVQSTLGGLGGCPFAPGASGNLATEDLNFMLLEMGFETGIDHNKLIEAAQMQSELIPTGLYSGHLYRIGKLN